MTALALRALSDRDTVLCWSLFVIILIVVMAVPA